MSNAHVQVAANVAPSGDPAPRIEELLLLTSRTFALCIPVLPRPLREEVTVAYLLLRIADTFEDMSQWPPALRIAALERFRTEIETTPGQGTVFGTAGMSGDCPADGGDRQLLSDSPLVLHALEQLSHGAAIVVRRHVARSIAGMVEFLRSANPCMPGLRDLDELRRYCYYVAGIVGEMLTELFLRAVPRLGICATELRTRAATFGEALQLVNILKDAETDAAEGRFYLPCTTPLSAVFTMARTDLEVAAEYTRFLQSAGAPDGVVEFAAIPVALARATLRAVESDGPGARVSRADVAAIVQRVHDAVTRGARAV